VRVLTCQSLKVENVAKAKKEKKRTFWKKDREKTKESSFKAFVVFGFVCF